MSLKEDVRKIMSGAGIDYPKITDFLGSNGKTGKPLKAVVSFRNMFKIYKSGGDLNKIMEYADKNGYDGAPRTGGK